MKRQTARLLRGVIRLIEDDVTAMADAVVEIDQREAANHAATRARLDRLDTQIAERENVSRGEAAKAISPSALLDRIDGELAGVRDGLIEVDHKTASLRGEINRLTTNERAERVGAHREMSRRLAALEADRLVHPVQA